MLEQLQSCIYCSINPASALSVPPSDFKVDAFSSEANCAQSCIVRVATAASDFSPAELSLALLPPWVFPLRWNDGKKCWSKKFL